MWWWLLAIYLIGFLLVLAGLPYEMPENPRLCVAIIVLWPVALVACLVLMAAAFILSPKDIRPSDLK